MDTPDDLPRALEGLLGTVISLLSTGAYDAAANMLRGWDRDVAFPAEVIRAAIEPAAGPYGLLPKQSVSDALASHARRDDGRIELSLELVCDDAASVHMTLLAEGRAMGLVDAPLWSAQLIEIARRAAATPSTRRLLEAAAARPLDPWVVWTQAMEAPAESLTEPMRRVLAIGWVRSEINNGGFDQLLFNSAGDLLPTAVVAARDAGCEALAELLERGVAPLGDRYPVDRHLRQQAIQSAEPGAWEQHMDSVTADYLRIEEDVDLDALMRHYAGQAGHDDSAGPGSV